VNILLMPAKKALPFDEVKNFSGMWQHYLHRELSAMGHKVTFDRGVDPHAMPEAQVLYCKEMALSRLGRVEHIIGMSRYFTRIDPSCVGILRAAVPGSVTQIHDGPLPAANTDTVFTLRDDGPKFMTTSTYIGWAADEEKLMPKQGPMHWQLRILIDHPLYHDGMDHTDEISRSALDWARARERNVLIRRFCNGGVETVTEENWKSPEFTRVQVPFDQIADEYRQAHLFMVTHRESLGLSVIESAMCGALPVVPLGYITPDRMTTVRGLVYKPGTAPPWDEAIEEINIPASRAKAQKNSWRAAVQRIVDYLEGFKK
jgi:hypothetical protein